MRYRCFVWCANTFLIHCILWVYSTFPAAFQIRILVFAGTVSRCLRFSSRERATSSARKCGTCGRPRLCATIVAFTLAYAPSSNYRLVSSPVAIFALFFCLPAHLCAVLILVSTSILRERCCAVYQYDVISDPAAGYPSPSVDLQIGAILFGICFAFVGDRYFCKK